MSEEQKLKRHANWVAVFLVVAHIAMIFGMLDPAVQQSGAAAMPEHGSMRPH